jgi:6-phosphogluconolactonase (cycloisomerase 2 family)
MKRTRWAGLLLLAAPLLSGCAGFWQNPSSSSTSDVGTSTLSSGVFFVLNQTDAEIVPYYISTGTLESSYGPYSLSYTPYSMAVSPNGDFLYVGTSGGIFAYSISSYGALALLQSSAIVADDYPYEITVDPSGKWLLDASGAGYLYAIPISTSTGFTTSSSVRSVALPATTPKQIAVSSDGAYVFVACGTAGTEVYSFDYASSTPAVELATISLANSSGAAYSVAVDPSLRVYYVGETAAYSSSSNSGGVRVFSYSSLTDSSEISELSDSPYASGGLAPYAILPEAASDGDYIYVANRTVSGSSYGNIVSFELTSSSGYGLTKLSSTTTGYYTTSLAEDNKNNYLLTTNYGKGGSAGGDPDLAGYNFDSSTTGALDYVIENTTGTDPVGAIQVVAVP